MILTEIGEVGLHVGDCVHRLRPSLYAMSKLGTPKEIVELYASVMGESKTLLLDALAVVQACSGEDLSEVIGYCDHRLKLVLRRAQPEDLVVIARHLLQHGIIGVLPAQPRPHDAEVEYSSEFNAREYVALAMAHLSLSERDAWNLTMTGFLGAMRAKFPPSASDTPGANAPSLQEAEETLAWHDAVLAKRRQNKG